MQPRFPLRVAVLPRNSQSMELSGPDQRMIIHPVRRRGPPEKFSPTAAPMQVLPCYIFAGALAVAMHCHLPSGIFIQVSTQRSWASIALPLPSVPLPCHAPPAIAVFPNVVALEVANVADLPITSLDHSQQLGFAAHGPKAEIR